MSEIDEVEAAHPSTHDSTNVEPTDNDTTDTDPTDNDYIITSGGDSATNIETEDEPQWFRDLEAQIASASALDGEAENTNEAEDPLEEFVRERLEESNLRAARISRRRAARRRRPDGTSSSSRVEPHHSPGNSPEATAAQLPAQPPEPSPIDLAFDQFKKWIDEREKAVARRVQKSGVALDDVARMGALVYVVLEEKYSGCSAERLRPMINALLEPLEYNMRFGVHKSDDPFPGVIPLYSDLTNLLEFVIDNSSAYRRIYARLVDDAAEAETVFRALREATKPRPDPAFRPTAWLTADEDLVRTHPVPQGSVQELMGLLNNMTGLDSVKNVVRGETAKIQVDARRTELGLSVPTQTRHVLFQGNPGTGKTTVARIIAGIYRSAGLLYNDHIVETDSSGLVSKWRGNTPQKTNAAIDEALGGVLFIDEAYSLVSNEGQQAIDTLVKRMEDDREDLVVILAGYPDKMAELLATNPGLASRIGLTIDFPDYTNVELMDILDTMLKESEYTMTHEARMHVQRRLETVQRESDFGNARTVRNVLESASRCQAIRLGELLPDSNFNWEPDSMMTGEDNSALTREQVMELTTGDFDQAMDLVLKSKSQETGFGFGTPGGCVLG